MKAWVLEDSFGLENLSIKSISKKKIKKNEILIAVLAASINYRDLLMINGSYNKNQKLPLIPLSDGVGEVIKIGPSVKNIKIGDRVCANIIQDWICGEFKRDMNKSMLGGPINGMLSEYVLINENSAIKVPDYLSDIEAATLPCAALTAWHAITSSKNLHPGSSLIIQGTGGVALFALQFAKIKGIRAIILTSNDKKMSILKKIGAFHVINYKQNPNWSTTIRQLTGNGADAVLEVGGINTINESVKSLKTGGEVLLIGNLTGGNGMINLIPILMNQISINGILVGNKNMFNQMNIALDFQQIHPIIDCVFTFSQAKKAFNYLKENKHIGKICIKI